MESENLPSEPLSMAESLLSNLPINPSRVHTLYLLSKS